MAYQLYVDEEPLALKVTVPPLHPVAPVTVGAEGRAFTVTTVTEDVVLQPDVVTVTV